MNENIADTKQFKSVDDVTDTTAMPTQADGETLTTILPVASETNESTTVLPVAAEPSEPMTTVMDAAGSIAEPTTAMETATTVLPQSDAAEPVTSEPAEADASEAELSEDDASEPTTSLLNQPIGETEAIPPANDVPLYAAAASQPLSSLQSVPQQPVQPQSMPRQSMESQQSDAAPAQPANSQQPRAAESRTQPQGASKLTIVFGMIGLAIGIPGLLFGMIFPDLPVPQFVADPQVMTAIVCAALGMLLIIIAIVWAISGALRNKREPKQE